MDQMNHVIKLIKLNKINKTLKVFPKHVWATIKFCHLNCLIKMLVKYKAAKRWSNSKWFFINKHKSDWNLLN